ncbi:hypothetical protein ACHAQI_005109 [Fusarium lateritium]
MEAVGLAVGLVGLFSTCLEAVQRIDSYKTAGRDSRLLCAQIDATMHLFERWGDSVGIGKGKLSDNHHPALDEPKTFSVVKNLLQSFEEFSTATTTYNATGPKAIQRVPSIPLPDSASQNLSKNSRWQRTGWALRGKLKQTNHVEALATLVSELYSVVPPETAIVASIRQKPLSRTASFKNQHGTALGSSQDAVTADQPSVADVRDILLELQQGLRAEALQDLRTWIGSPPPNHLYDESKDRRLEQTCEWMIHRQEFLNWQAPSTSNKLLWIKGPAGFGCTFILDGLDECTGMNSTDSKSVSNFLDQLKKTILHTGTRLLICSRADHIIQQGLSSFPGYTEYTILSTDVGPDLGVYSAEVVKTRLSNKDEATRKFIAQKLQERCLGQFQWIKLQEGSLRPGRNKKQLEKEIDETPSGLDSLYDREWNRIMSMEATDKARALRLLQWAAFSMRPLTVYEITEAVLMTEDCEEFPFDEMPDAIDKHYIDSMILDLCGSLIEVRLSPIDEVEQKQSSESGKGDENGDMADIMQRKLGGLDVGMQEVHLSHFSVKEYLLHKIVPNDANLLLNEGIRVSHERHENMALSKNCIRYLSLPGAWDDWQMIDTRPTMRLLLYAAMFWDAHYDMAETPDPDLRDEVNSFFDSRNSSFLSWRSWWETDYSTRSQGMGTLLQMGPLALAMYFGLNDVAKHIIHERNHELKHRSKRNWSALHYACRWGDQNNTELLLESGAELDTMTDRGQTPLFLAINARSRSVVELLISRGANTLLADNDGRTPLHRASKLGDLKTVKQLIEHGAEITSLTKYKFTPLLLAAARGHSGIVSLLLAKGADLNETSKDGLTSLHLASGCGHCECARQLIDQGANVEALTKRGTTPLGEASARGRPQVVSMLLESGAKLDQPVEAHLTPLFLASAFGHCEVVKILLQRGADWRYPDKDGWTSIYAAALNDHTDVVEMLLDEGASFNASRDANSGESLLCVAAHTGNLNLAKLIIDRGASVEDRCFAPHEATPLYEASSEGHLEMVELLLEKGADVNAVSEELRTPLHEASMRGHYDVAQLLIQEGADLSAKSKDFGFTPLIIALANSNLEAFALLLENGSPVTSTSKFSWTPLHVAAVYGDPQFIKPLLDKGANIFAKDDQNQEPIHLAAKAGHLEFIKVLLQEGADATVNDLCGRSALIYAARYGHEPLVELLTTETDSELAITDNCSRTPLHHACQGGHLHIVKWMLGLLQARPETIDSADYWGSTPLSIAVRKGYAGLVKLLLDTNTVNIDSSDNFGRKLVWWATEQGHSEILRLLTEQNQIRDLEAEIRDEEVQDSVKAAMGDISTFAQTVFC